MVDYSPTTWVPGLPPTGTEVTAARLNKGEQGIKTAQDTANTALAAATADTLPGATTVGKAVVKAADATAARTALSAVGKGELVFNVMFAAATATTGVTASDRAYVARTLTGARMRVAGAPVGSSLVAQVQHFDGSSWTTLGTLTTTTGSTVEATAAFTQDQLVGNLVRLNITSVGSTTAASGVAVDVTWH